MDHDIINTTVIIPSLNPTQELIPYIQSLITTGFRTILIINDGSSSAYNPIFETLSEIKHCLVLKHTKNRGKGQALKTGYAYIKAHHPDCKHIVTADADGQHAVTDVYAVAKAVNDLPKSVVLGVRDFSEKKIPFRSFIGNRLTSLLVFILFGQWLGDTQTGLRGFPAHQLDRMLAIKGSRFEYEMQVLIDLIASDIKIFQVKIKTIYDDQNQGSHFQVVKDTLQIFKVLVSNFVLFFSSSLLSALVDLSLAWFFLFLLENKLANFDLLRIAIASLSARGISIGVNYLLNKTIVFKSDERKSLRRYLSLSLAIIALSTFFVYFLQDRKSVV